MHQRLGAGGKVPSMSNRAVDGRKGVKGCVSTGASPDMDEGSVTGSSGVVRVM
ncbi:hypothetical protein HMPREF9136_0440 [Prevotella dentalis DSM 3688]|uniref:Uncharacterized protein n=1 Tax=Prevotella dentalis (strain ATCC 49559 / DSM 3688 / JCM 13448 / NCTC 12043 / ES 2772) TaxID=908937 RepID=F9D0R2_PREDD|nr:hypothetical protein HMPREF9136_0440 [Prevotella dentalis DSM 3688]